MSPRVNGSDDLHVVSVEEILSILEKLNVDSATGPDGIPTRVLNCCATALAKSVHILLQRIIEIGEWPKSWKLHWIVALYKKKQ